ncbi:hypothetical protein ARSEF4850_002424 [Beauveria asiatica]
MISSSVFPPSTAEYPVVPSYENFRCPTTLPESWAAESPHIEPTATDDALSEWWQRNSMFTYTANPDLSSDMRRANSRSQSPKKRARSAQGTDETEIDEAELDWSASRAQYEQRGRRRRRIWSPDASPGREEAKFINDIQ